MTTNNHNAQFVTPSGAIGKQPVQVGEVQGVELPPLPDAWYRPHSHNAPIGQILFSEEQMQDYARAALAARQPGVQEPVGEVYQYGFGRSRGAKLYDGVRDTLAFGALLYAAPPAQGTVTAEMLAAADAYHASDEYKSGQFGDDYTNAACYRAMAAAAPTAQEDVPYQRIPGLQGIGDAADYLARRPGDDYAQRRLSERVTEFCQKHGVARAQGIDLGQQQDAARWRWVREQSGVTVSVEEADDDGDLAFVSGHTPAELDAAIDGLRDAAPEVGNG